MVKRGHVVTNVVTNVVKNAVMKLSLTSCVPLDAVHGQSVLLSRTPLQNTDERQESLSKSEKQSEVQEANRNKPSHS